jgi:hypothetical protein
MASKDSQMETHSDFDAMTVSIVIDSELESSKGLGNRGTSGDDGGGAGTAGDSFRLGGVDVVEWCWLKCEIRSLNASGPCEPLIDSLLNFNLSTR